MSNSITETDFNFPGQKAVYHGKVRDVYTLENDIVVMIASDRISAFDHILPKGIPHKGQVLNQVATMFLDVNWYSGSECCCWSFLRTRQSRNGYPWLFSRTFRKAICTRYSRIVWDNNAGRNERKR